MRCHAGGYPMSRIEYYEPGHTLHLNPDLTNGMRITLNFPQRLVWNYPPGHPMDPAKWAEVRGRISGANNTGLDSDFSVFIAFPKGG